MGKIDQGGPYSGAVARAGAPEGSEAGRSAKVVVQADTQDVVGDVRAEACGHKIAARGDNRRNERSRNRSKIDVEIFDLAGPILPQHAFEATPDGPAAPGGVAAK